MTLASQTLAGRSFTTIAMPSTFQTYCYSCNVLIRPGNLAKRYDGATFVHETCPGTPHKTYAPHKYGSAK